MRFYGFVLLTLSVLTACTTTKHTLFPAYGYDFQAGDKLIIAKFQNAPSDIFSEQITNALVKSFQDCGGIEVIPYDSVQDIFYQKLDYRDPIWQVDTELMVKLYTQMKSRYLLVGKVTEKPLHGTPPVSTSQRYGNGYQEEIYESWTTFQFTLYDLATTQTLLTSQTRAKANHYDYNDDDGDTHSFYAPTNLPQTALVKGIKKFREACRCTVQ